MWAMVRTEQMSTVVWLAMGNGIISRLLSTGMGCWPYIKTASWQVLPVWSMWAISTRFFLTIGQDGTRAYPYRFNGKISEVRIWNTGLSAETVATWTCASVNNTHVNYGNLLAYWKMDEGRHLLDSPHQQHKCCTTRRQCAMANWKQEHKLVMTIHLHPPYCRCGLHRVDPLRDWVSTRMEFGRA